MEQIRKRKELKRGYEHYRVKLFPFAYNVLGDTQEAEDVVQEILNDHFLFPDPGIVNPDAYLVRSVINRSINAKKKLKIRREHYNGHWLPGPVKTEESIYGDVDKGRILDYSLLVLLERLTAKERAVFILKESFAYSHSEIGEMLNFTEENSRQLYRRGRRRLGELKPEPKTAPDYDSVKRLTDAILERDLEKVKSLLAKDVESVSDGGYHARCVQNIISGRHDVGRLILALYGKYYRPGTEVSYTRVNHSPAILFTSQGQIYRCIIFRVSGGLIDAVYIMVNPGKLHSLES